jgi:hypothetical protein
VTAPWGVAVDASGSVLISDKESGHIVRVPSVSGTLTSADALTIETNPKSALGLALDSAGNIYTTDGSGAAVYAVNRNSASFNLGSVDDGATARMELWFESDGNVSLSAVTGTTASKNFTVSPSSTDGCSSSYTGEPGSACSFDVEFAPLAGVAGAVTGTATVSVGSMKDTVSLGGTAILHAAKVTPTINWPKPAAIVYGTPLSETQYDVSATYKGVPVLGGYVFNPRKGTVLDAGTHTLTTTFTPGETATYNVVKASVDLTVDKAPQVITFAKIKNETYASGLVITLSATGGKSGNPVVFSIVKGATHASIKGNKLTIKEAGAFEIAANQGATSNYHPAAEVTQSFTVTPATQTITFTPPTTAKKGSKIALTAKASSGLAVKFAVTGPATLNTTTNELTFTNTGTVKVTASQGGNADYSAAASVTKSITVTAN